MKQLLMLILLLCGKFAHSQELYVFSEPASNMPSHTVTPKLSLQAGREDGRWMQRYAPEVMFGFSKNFMLHLSTSLSNVGVSSVKAESFSVYGKYRFLSLDEVHRHFRMAAFMEASVSRNPSKTEEVSLRGERSGVQVGFIATQLIHKFAASLTIGNTQVIEPSRFATDAVWQPPYQSINYTLSAGVLLLPIEYENFDQLNVNFYTELLGQQTIDRKTFYNDLAPSLQFIFRSNSKLNLGYRFQLSGSQVRSMRNNFLISFEHTFFNGQKAASK